MKALDNETSTVLQQISTEKKYKKGDFLLRQNEICGKSYLVIDGIARKYYLNDGKEITTELYFENDLAISFDSYALQQPSKEFIEALTDITVSITHYTAFQEAKAKYPKLLVLDLMITEYYAMWVENRLFEFHTMSATERYVDILEKSPHIVQTVPLTIIASYLGISLETLSRIRAKI
jgi:CRP-like cAMP-binding protein